MFTPSKLKRCRRDGSVSRVFRRVGMAVATACMLTIVIAGDSLACPKGDNGNDHQKAVAAVVHKPVVKMVFVASASTSGAAVGVNSIDCCGHCSGMGVANGCCPACASAIVAFNPTLTPEYISQVHVLPLEAGAAHTKPPPEFRPPRIFA